MSDVTRILSQIEQGDPRAAEELLPLIYEELRKLAAVKLAHENPGQTLQATALVHEAYLRLVERNVPETNANRSPTWDHRGHFFAAAAEAMRRILVENARRKQRDKHGGQLQRVEFSEQDLVGHMQPRELLALDEALTQLAAEAPLKAKLVELRFFTGMTVEEAAQNLGISGVTAKRHWRYARAWLHQRISDDEIALASRPAKNRDFSGSG